MPFSHGECLPNRLDANPPAGPASGFGASATAKICIEASLTGAIKGKGGMNSSLIYQRTGVKLCVRDHERDPNQKNIELEGTFEQISEASAMVKELICTLAFPAVLKMPSRDGGRLERKPRQGSNFKTKMCENFARPVGTVQR